MAPALYREHESHKKLHREELAPVNGRTKMYGGCKRRTKERGHGGGSRGGGEKGSRYNHIER